MAAGPGYWSRPSTGAGTWGVFAFSSVSARSKDVGPVQHPPAPHQRPGGLEWLALEGNELQRRCHPITSSYLAAQKSHPLWYLPPGKSNLRGFRGPSSPQCYPSTQFTPCPTQGAGTVLAAAK